MDHLFSPVANALSEMTVGILHCDTWRTFLSGKSCGVQDIIQLSRTLPELQQHLVCAVCKKLVSYDVVIPKSECNHPICKDCKTDDLILELICPKENPCTEYEENKLFNLVLKSYTLFCHLILTTPEYNKLIKPASEKDATFEALQLIGFLKEGALREVCRPNSPKLTVSEDDEIDTTDFPASDTYDFKTSEFLVPTSTKNFSTAGRSSTRIGESSKRRRRSAVAKAPKIESGDDADDEGGHHFKRFCKIEPQSRNDDYEDDQVDEFIARQEVLVTSTPPSVSPCKIEPTSSNQTMRPNTNKWPNPNHILAYAADRMGVCSRAEPNNGTNPALAAQLVGTVIRAVEGSMKKLKVRLPKTPTPPRVRKGCRCGNAAAVPGKLTCCGQRCPCYVENKACYDCRCKGCRNPHLSDGKKLLQGINAVIDTKTNTTVQLAPPNYDGNSEGPYHPLGPIGRYARYSVQLPAPSIGSNTQSTPGPTLTQSVKTEPMDFPNNDEDF